MRINISTVVNRNFENVSERFDKELFLALKPPLIQLDLQVFDGCVKGDKVEMELGLLGVKQSWKSLITENGASPSEIYFVDEGIELPPPLKTWKHRHVLENIGNTKTKIVDDIYYSSGNKLLDILIYPIMYIQFWYRKPIYKRFFS